MLFTGRQTERLRPASLYLPFDSNFSAKGSAEVCCSDASSHSFDNSEAGHAKLLRWLRRKTPALVILEATSGYERACAVALASASLPVSAINPRQARAVSN